ncbi:hypothetical protein KIN20_035225 [Parelaphostrongylus tenuis]|uniref:Uncharacterized protein n=1 Tax=Parelaphostrongylus tenuis TaxID=148309 RepID=A0AAD5RAS5_PARTN|nr:hypothetical protein KIN20_035225 [Parelaphostrongylus tenuis]
MKTFVRRPSLVKIVENALDTVIAQVTTVFFSGKVQNRTLMWAKDVGERCRRLHRLTAIPVDIEALSCAMWSRISMQSAMAAAKMTTSLNH